MSESYTEAELRRMIRAKFDNPQSPDIPTDLAEN